MGLRSIPPKGRKNKCLYSAILLSLFLSVAGGHITFPAPQDHRACCWTHCSEDTRESPQAVESWATEPHGGKAEGTWAGRSHYLLFFTDLQCALITAYKAAFVTSESSKMHISIFNIWISILL